MGGGRNLELEVKMLGVSFIEGWNGRRMNEEDDLPFHCSRWSL